MRREWRDAKSVVRECREDRAWRGYRGRGRGWARGEVRWQSKAIEGSREAVGLCAGRERRSVRVEAREMDAEGKRLFAGGASALRQGSEAEEVGVGAGAGEFEDEDVAVDFVDEKPVGGDVAFAVGGPDAGEGVVTVGGREGDAVAEFGDHRVEFFDGRAALEKPLVVALERGGVADGKGHSARSFQRASRSVYVGASGSSARRSPSRRAARVSALGRGEPSMMKGMRFSRRTVLMYTVMTEEAERPMSAQKRLKRFLVRSSREMVRLDMGRGPFVCSLSGLYVNYTCFANKNLLCCDGIRWNLRRDDSGGRSSDG